MNSADTGAQRNGRTRDGTENTRRDMMNNSRQSGFTLIEIVVVIAVLALLAGLALPMLGSTTNDARVTKILAGLDQQRKAVQRFHNDTRQYATERSDRTGESNHELTMNQRITGWKGPYLDHVLSQADNPFDDAVLIYPDLEPAGGFDQDGDGRTDARGHGQIVVYRNVDRTSAEQIDGALDRGIPGDWNRTGRVKWSDNTLYVLLYFVSQSSEAAPTNRRDERGNGGNDGDRGNSGDRGNGPR